MIEVNAIKCGRCGDTVYSRARHDFRSCTCGAVAADGGRDYFKCCFNPEIPHETLTIKVDATARELYDDWNQFNSGDKFGLIKGNDESQDDG